MPVRPTGLRRLCAVAAVAVTSVALVPGSPAAAAAAGGTVKGFSTADFVFLNALQTTSGTLGQLTIGQAAAGASTNTLTSTNALGELVLQSAHTGKNAFGHGAGVSANLGSPPGGIPQIAQTLAEAVSPPPAHRRTVALTVPAAPVATADVLPSTADANTTLNTGSPSDFCPTIGGPISQGSGNIADAQVAPSASGAVADEDSAAHVVSDQRLLPNGVADHFGLSSASTLSTTGVTLFKGVTGAEISIQVVAPVTLQAFAAGIAGKSKVAFGDNGSVNVVKIVTSGGTVLLTLNQLLGGGADIDADGLLKIHIGLSPTSTVSADGTSVIAAADLVKITVVGAEAPSQGTVGGPLAPVLNPILGTVFSTLDQTTVFQQIDSALRAAGITTAADFRLGHFESRAQVPAGGVECSIPVHKTATPDPVRVGHDFVYSITVDNPFNCVLNPVKLVDEITAEPGVTWHVVGTSPTASTVTDGLVTWNNIGPIAAKKSRTVTMTLHVPSDSAAGIFHNTAKATAECKGSGGVGNTAIGNGTITLTGQVKVRVPRAVSVAGGPLPQTGGNAALPLVALGLLAGGVGVAAVTRRRSVSR
jgi:LPXTG-motif cell wall-anchored protein